MKLLSSAIVIHASALMLVGSAFIRTDEKFFLMLAGLAVGVAGFIGWLVGMGATSKDS